MPLHDQSALVDPRPEYVVSGFAFPADHLLPSHLAGMHGLAPQQTEAPFVVTQAAVLTLFVGLTVLAVRRFRGESIDEVIAPKVHGSVRLS